MNSDSKGEPTWASSASMLGWYSKQSSGASSGPSPSAEPERPRKPERKPERKTPAGKLAQQQAPAPPLPGLDAQLNRGGIATAAAGPSGSLGAPADTGHELGAPLPAAPASKPPHAHDTATATPTPTAA